MDKCFRQRLLHNLLRIRLVEEAIAERYPEQEMRCPVHLSTGQEAIAVGVCAALDDQDFVMSTHRAHAHYLARGGDLKKMMAEIYGKETGCSSGRGGSMHLVDLEVNFVGSTPILGNSLPIAVGVAFGSWLKEEQSVTVVFFGEGATEEGVFQESINFASLKELPIVFICENNLYSVYSPLSVRQPSKRNRVLIAQAHGMEGFRGDGNDVETVYHLSKQAIGRARKGQGPTFLEFDTYRWREHCGPNYDNDLGYRTEAEFIEWRERCPVANYQASLIREGAISERELEEMIKHFHREIDEALIHAKTSPFPKEDQLMANVYWEAV